MSRWWYLISLLSSVEVSFVGSGEVSNDTGGFGRGFTLLGRCWCLMFSVSLAEVISVGSVDVSNASVVG